MHQRGFFDYENRLQELSDFGNPLERLNKSIDWNIFSGILQKIQPVVSGRGGRPPYPRMLLFKMLIVKRFYNLSCAQTEFQCKDSLTKMEFIGVPIGGRVPDEKTIWNFEEDLANAGLSEELFDVFQVALEEMGVRLNSGQIVDATFVAVPRQRNSKEENELIKSGSTPEEWEENQNKLRQKDVDARWTKKGNETHYGYKNHTNVDKDSKLIIKATVTSAEVHDSQALLSVLLDKECGDELYADSAYRSEEIEGELQKRGIGSRIHERSYRNSPLNEQQKVNNKEKSRTRARVEHVYATMTNEMGGIFLRTIGKVRAKSGITLINLVYNLKRVGSLIKNGFFEFDRVIAPLN